jgi:hypothetical protein
MKADEFPHFEIEFGLNGKFQGRPVNFDPYADKAVTVRILKAQLAGVEQLSRRRPQTDRVLTRLAKKKSALETLIESFSDAGSSTVLSATSRKDKRITKKLRRKAARFDQMRK